MGGLPGFYILKFLLVVYLRCVYYAHWQNIFEKAFFRDLIVYIYVCQNAFNMQFYQNAGGKIPKS